ncbi:allophanate hydrolase [Leptothrix discophora]|uniref:Allophanate hydrolase n=1 Tax=Leptothrix discophora TaxID=89 RepID=A0ABT9G5W1_LEPDI|nr:allophanate hydrolase [Leptothrix discophora]MDP4301876.1 allophanate hydrolase [Leptothrix discophora]
MSAPSLDLATLRADYLAGRRDPLQVVEQVLAATAGEDVHHAWISRVPPETLRARARALMARDPATLPLWGVPFAVKDNIDVEGLPTTAGCPAYAYEPARSATVVQRLVDAGALVVGKTNLDQFATGLNGTRSPYGACRNAFDPDFVSGGSSAGSAVSVARGQVSFSLGTDTAGSGRVPAAFNQLVGLKPTRGLLSTRGVLPACQTLDVVSVFALTADDAAAVLAVAQGFDAEDPCSRATQPHGHDIGRAPQPRLGVPRRDQRIWTEPACEAAFDAAIEQARALGAELVELDFEPFYETARLLYEGPWVAERYGAIRDFIERQPEAVFPVTREITLGGKALLAADAYAAQVRLLALRRRCDAVWSQVDAVLTPTAPGHPTIDAMRAEPIVRNSELGVYTNFMNLLDCAAVALPSGWLAGAPGRPGRPFGITVFAPAHQDVPLLRLAARWQAALTGPAATLGATGHPLPTAPVPAPANETPSGQVRVAVCGAHLSGQPLNPQLTSRGARLVAATHTAPVYRLYALPDGKRPGLQRVAEGASPGGATDGTTPRGVAIEVEVWELPATAFGSFVAAIPAPLGIGRTLLADGSEVPGFICEASGLAGARDISAYGGWRAWRASLAG